MNSLIVPFACVVGESQQPKPVSGLATFSRKAKNIPYLVNPGDVGRVFHDSLLGLAFLPANPSLVHKEVKLKFLVATDLPNN
jgi:hypothetical protein